MNNNLSTKISGFSGSGYSAVTGLAYDATNKKLGLKVGADSVIPFNGGIKEIWIFSYTRLGYVTITKLAKDEPLKTQTVLASFTWITSTIDDIKVRGSDLPNFSINVPFDCYSSNFLQKNNFQNSGTAFVCDSFCLITKEPI